MFTDAALAELQLQKQRLLVEGDLHRRTLAREWSELKESFSFIKPTTDIVSRWRPILTILAPVVGWVVARMLRSHNKGGHLLAKAGNLWQLVNRVWRGWQFVRRFVG